MTMKRTRKDALPEHLEYSDDGCPDGAIPSCLGCPLAMCRYDVDGGIRALLNQTRDSRIRMARYRDERSVEQIAEDEGVSRRTVFRALAVRR